jgi:hypothetical protein
MVDTQFMFAESMYEQRCKNEQNTILLPLRSLHSSDGARVTEIAITQGITNL